MVRLIFFLSLIALFSHCGYSLKHRLKDNFQGGQGRIFVPVFDNRTEEIGAEQIFTNALIRELISRGEWVESSRESATIELRGSVDSIDNQPTGFTEPGFKGLQSYRRLPTEIGVKVSLRLALFDLKKNEEIWAKGFDGFRRVNAPGVTSPFTRTFDYEAPSSLANTTQSVIRFVYMDVARDIMRDVYDEIVELF